MKGFDDTFKLSYQEINQKLHDSGHAHPVSCVDCHDPSSMALRVTRPGFIRGIRALAASDAPVPALPSIQQWREGARASRTIRTATRPATRCARSCAGSATSSTTAAAR